MHGEDRAHSLYSEIQRHNSIPPCLVKLKAQLCISKETMVGNGGMSSKLILYMQTSTMRPWKCWEQSSPQGTASVLGCHNHHWDRGAPHPRWGSGI